MWRAAEDEAYFWGLYEDQQDRSPKGPWKAAFLSALFVANLSDTTRRSEYIYIYIYINTCIWADLTLNNANATKTQQQHISLVLKRQQKESKQ